jgi:hypothetical protein
MNLLSSPMSRKHRTNDTGVATLIEYVMVTGIIMVLFISMLLLVHTNFVDTPVRTITYSAFADIGNGLSTRIVDVYAVSPRYGAINSRFDLPDDIVGRSYLVEISAGTKGQTVDISRDYIQTHIALAGIGASQRGVAGGNTTGAGVNRVSFDSRGFS